MAPLYPTKNTRMAGRLFLVSQWNGSPFRTEHLCTSDTVISLCDRRMVCTRPTGNTTVNHLTATASIWSISMAYGFLADIGAVATLGRQTPTTSLLNEMTAVWADCTWYVFPIHSGTKSQIFLRRSPSFFLTSISAVMRTTVQSKGMCFLEGKGGLPLANPPLLS